MSENAAEATTETTEAPESEAPAQDKDWKAEAEKIKAEARKWETRAKENSKAAERLAELEDAQKSAEQKAAERLAAAEAKAAELEGRALRLEVAAEKGVPADLLTGATREDLEAAADKLIAFRGEQKPAPISASLSKVGSGEARKPEPATPGIGRMRAAYAEAEKTRS
jgi:uncharacterized protein (DUF3084 family)